MDSERTLMFVSAGPANGRDDGCAAVISIVEKLRENGNLAVWGLVDMDQRETEPSPGVYFNPHGYAIENIVLDPLSVGLLLLADGDNEVRQAVPESTFVQFRSEDAQTLVDAVVWKVLSGESNLGRTQIEYRGGSTVACPDLWLAMRGHDLESRILEAFPSLLRYRNNHRFLSTVIQRVWAQDPSRIPASVEATFARFLDG